MKIESIEPIHLLFPYPPDRAFEYAGGRCTGRLTSLVRVHTSTGAVGLGSAYTHPGLLDVLIRDQLEPLLLGEDPREVEGLWEKLYGVTRWYGRKGAALTTLGALDTAFWDLRGQALGKPVRQLLDPGAKAGCPAYASALLWNDLEALRAEAGALIERGFRRVKMRLGRSEDYDTAAVAVVRDAIGAQNDLLVDASMRYHVALAERIARVLKENDVFWFEEPFAPEDLDSYADLRGRIEVPIAAGENEFGVQGFRELIRCGCVDIVQPDASRAGGISELVRVGALAQKAGVSLATHTWNDAVAVVANAQAVAALPCGITVEVDQTGNPLVDELLVEPLRVENGWLRLSDAPGLGIELRDDVVQRWRLPNPPMVPEGNYSDMVFGRDHFSPAGVYVEKD